MDKKYINLKENIYEDLFKSVVISGSYPLLKLNDMKDYIDALIIECQDLENINDKLSSALKSAEDKLDKIVDLQKENKQLKEKLKSKPDTEITLTDSKGNIYTIIQSERIELQEKLNKSIQQLLKENKHLKDNWNELKEYIRNFPAIEYSSLEKVDGIRLSGKLLREDYLLNKMQELE